MDNITATKILDLPLDFNDAKAATVREYLIELLKLLWVEEEGFDGKRPFGNSGWQRDLAPALIKAGYLEGTVDEDGWAEEFDSTEYNQIILDVIGHLR